MGCAQALLPEALVPLTLLRHAPGCAALLCGDPRWAVLLSVYMHCRNHCQKKLWST